jgi:PUB domain
LENKKIKDELLVVCGMKQLLVEIGFREGTDGKMVLPNDVLLDKLKRYRQYVKERHDTLSSSTSKKTVVREVEVQLTSREIMVEKLFADRVRFPKVLVINRRVHCRSLLLTFLIF